VFFLFVRQKERTKEKDTTKTNRKVSLYPQAFTLYPRNFRFALFVDVRPPVFIFSQAFSAKGWDFDTPGGA
jgi:hypothetical protein